jgi:hypothetical protein
VKKLAALLRLANLMVFAGIRITGSNDFKKAKKSYIILNSCFSEIETLILQNERKFVL